MPRKTEKGIISPPVRESEIECHEQVADGRERALTKTGLSTGL